MAAKMLAISGNDNFIGQEVNDVLDLKRWKFCNDFRTCRKSNVIDLMENVIELGSLEGVVDILEAKIRKQIPRLEFQCQRGTAIFAKSKKGTF
jgi:hypothetical protein